MKQIVLIADDEPSLRLLVSATLTSDDYDVVEAKDGEEAWELMSLHHPTLAILDVQMPGMTGLELTAKLRTDALLHDIRVILLSSKAQQVDVEAGVAAGAERYLAKPFSPLELVNVVEAALGLA